MSHIEQVSTFLFIHNIRSAIVHSKRGHMLFFPYLSSIFYRRFNMGTTVDNSKICYSADEK